MRGQKADSALERGLSQGEWPGTEERRGSRESRQGVEGSIFVWLSISGWPGVWMRLNVSEFYEGEVE